MFLTRGFGILAFVVCGSASLLSAQIDGDRFARDLKAKYGPPLARETFDIRPGVEMVVDFAQNGHVCRIQLPAVAPSTEPGQTNVRNTKAIDDLVLELAPLALRGKSLPSLAQAMSRHSISTQQYENVTISESRLDNRRTGVTISFPRDLCTPF